MAGYADAVWYYWMGTAAFLLALIADRRVVSPRSKQVALAGCSALVAFTVFTYVSIYLTWMGVGAVDVLGVQGRYLLAGVPLLAWLLPARRQVSGAMELLGSAAWLVTLFFVLRDLRRRAGPCTSTLLRATDRLSALGVRLGLPALADS